MIREPGSPASAASLVAEQSRSQGTCITAGRMYRYRTASPLALLEKRNASSCASSASAVVAAGLVRCC